MFTIWTDEKGRTREKLVAEKGKIIKGLPYGSKGESFSGGVIFGDQATSLVHSLNADRIFQVEPTGEKTRILLDTEPVEKKEVRFLWLKKELVVKERNIYGNLWKAPGVRVIKELDVTAFLHVLSKHQDHWVKKAVAENKNTELEVLRTLSSDSNEWVLAAVAGNPNTPEDILKALCGCSDARARALAIKRCRLSLDELKKMEAHETAVLPELAIKNKIKNHKEAPFFLKTKLALSGW